MKSEGTPVSAPSLPWDLGSGRLGSHFDAGRSKERKTVEEINRGDRVEAEIQNLHAMRAGVVFARLGPIA
jgi:hypothetical protein